MSGTKYRTGEANRQSKADFQRLKLAMDAYQIKKYPALIYSLPLHGRSKRVGIAPKTQADGRSARQSEKTSLLRCLSDAYSHSDSQDEFLAALRSKGHEPYYRAGQLTGIKYQGGGRKFRFRTLGYSRERIAELEKDLAELRDLRQSHSVTSERSFKGGFRRDSDEDDDDTLFDEADQENDIEPER
jgi:hypothetical protein